MGGFIVKTEKGRFPEKNGFYVRKYAHFLNTRWYFAFFRALFAKFLWIVELRGNNMQQSYKRNEQKWQKHDHKNGETTANRSTAVCCLC